MLNALKIPFSSGNDDVEDAGGGKFFKYKRPLLILFSFVLVIVVFSWFLNQKKPIVAKKKLPVPSISTPSEGKKTTTSSPPAVDKSHPAKISKPLPKGGKIELAYKGDKEYLTLNRYERFPQAEMMPATTGKQNVRDTVTAVDKPLALAGRGFDIQGFQSPSLRVRNADFTNRLQKPLPKRQHIPEDHLDLKLTQAKSSKDLIFHPLRPALGGYNRQTIHQEDQKLEKRKPQVLEDIPDTKLLWMDGGKSFLVLRRASESLDLLTGNEKINRKKYNRW
jgi:hypothetical protein